MKNLLLLFSLCFIFSCSNDSEADNSSEINSARIVESNYFSETTKKSQLDYNNVIGYLDEEKQPVLLVENKLLFKSMNSFNRANYSYDKAFIKTIIEDGITFYNLKLLGNQIKTSILVQNNGRYLEIFSTTCETSACSNNDGCEVTFLGAKCTKCTTDPDDCKKTTSNRTIMNELENIDPEYFNKHVKNVKSLKL